jgi:DNA-binding response OmpR family regulator
MREAQDGSEPVPLVLLVDDEPDILRLISKILQADGYEIDLASDGGVALWKIGERQYDLILLDVILPHLDGLGILQEVRKTDPHTGIIMVSALTSERITIDALLADADEYISKPFQLRELRLRIQQTLAKVALRRVNLQLQTQLARANAQIRDLVERFVPVEARTEVTFLELSGDEGPVFHGRAHHLLAGATKPEPDEQT